MSQFDGLLFGQELGNLPKKVKTALRSRLDRKVKTSNSEVKKAWASCEKAPNKNTVKNQVWTSGIFASL